MKNIFSYLDYYGDISFQKVCFNDADALIFALLSYVEFDQIVPSHRQGISLKEACKLFLLKFKGVDFSKKNWLFPNSFHLIEKLEKCKRYDSVTLSSYVNEVNEHGQFGALMIRENLTHFTYLSYEGTDSTIIGWKEDFEMVCNYPVYSQKRAKEYFDKSLSFFDRSIYIGGHSKGGNLAMYAYMYGKTSYKNRVKQVYSFDGPGFLEDILSLDIYKEMIPKLKQVVPQESMVGMLLYHDSYYPVKSHAKTILQHDAYSWEFFGGYFVPETLSLKSKNFGEKFKAFLDQLTIDEKQEFVDELFQVFADLKITNVMQLKDYRFTDFLSFIKELTEIPSKTKKNLLEIIKILIGVVNTF